MEMDPGHCRRHNRRRNRREPPRQIKEEEERRSQEWTWDGKLPPPALALPPPALAPPPPALAPPLGVMWGESLGKEKRPKETNGGEKA